MEVRVSSKSTSGIQLQKNLLSQKVSPGATQEERVLSPGALGGAIGSGVGGLTQPLCELFRAANGIKVTV